MTNQSSLGFKGQFIVTCYDKKGNLKWKDSFKNTVVNEGINHILDILFVSATTQIDPWYVGLLATTPTVSSTDTLTELIQFTDYDEVSRPEFTDSRTNQQVDNSGSEATFTINVNSSTIGGAFLASDATNGGTTGTLLCGSAFTNGDKSADSGDTLKVEYQFSGSSV